jgi:hypothetical protein
VWVRPELSIVYCFDDCILYSNCICTMDWFVQMPTYLLTPWSRVFLEKLSRSHLVKKFPAFYGTRRFITTFTSARHLSLSWARLIQSMLPTPIPDLSTYSPLLSTWRQGSNTGACVHNMQYSQQNKIQEIIFPYNFLSHTHTFLLKIKRHKFKSCSVKANELNGLCHLGLFHRVKF